MANLKEVEGIGSVYAGKLSEVGIATTGVLLEKGASPKGRNDRVVLAGVNYEKFRPAKRL